MSDTTTDNRGRELATVNVIGDNFVLTANASRAFMVLQNCGTAVVGISFSYAGSAPITLSNCSFRLYPATSDGAADGDLQIVSTSRDAMSVKFGDTGTKNLQITEYV